MIKRMNKRGQSNLTTGEVLGLVLGGIAVVVLILFVTGAFGSITDYFKKSNVDVAVLSQKCEGLLSQPTSAGFCNDKIEISSNNYVNCPYAIKNLGVKVETTQPDCTLSVTLPEAAICNNLKLEQGSKFNPEKIKVNGDTCSGWGVLQEGVDILEGA